MNNVNMGTFQEDVMSPLLAKIKLPNLENHSRAWYVDSSFTSKSWDKIQKTKALEFIRSADDFIKRVWKKSKIITAKPKKSKSVSTLIKTVTSLDETKEAIKVSRKVTPVETLKQVTDVVVELLKTTPNLKQKLNR
jgi:predicted secreted acid phosphatase